LALRVSCTPFNDLNDLNDLNMTQDALPRKISTPRRLGDSYELLLFALSCLRMVSDLSIEHVRHEDSSATPVDDVIIEFKDRIECFQAKHAMNPHALLDFEHDSGILFDTEIDEKKFKIEFLKLYEVWKLLQSRTIYRNCFKSTN
jgi:hypothetical protein